MHYVFENNLAFAKKKDAEDPLQHFRSRFYFPQFNNKDSIYFCNNSLGLQSKSIETAIGEDLADWKRLAIGGYYGAKNPWLYYQDQLSPSLARLAGCSKEEVTVMNSLTVNLHLMLLSFFRPNARKFKIIMEAGAFPSDQYAIETQMKLHSLKDAIIEISPRPGEKILREEDILDLIHQHKNELAMVLLGGVDYYSGQFLDIPLITEHAHTAGAIAAFDLAHAIGNLPLHLHDWNVDFAVWCSYKYLNAGPGSASGVFIHEKHSTNKELFRLGGWWGNDEATRFKMKKGFVPKPNASGWNISTAQVFNMAALRASLDIFDEAGIDSLRKKSMELTSYLEWLLNYFRDGKFEIITPRDPMRRGAQLSLYFEKDARTVLTKLQSLGIVVDFREPGVIRVAPTPMYNTFEEVFQFCEILKSII